MSPQPPLPKLPPLPPSPIDPLRGIIQQGRRQVEKARGELRSIAGETGSTTPAEVPAKTKPASERVSEGTACELCSSEHFSQTSGDLAEALRFARSEGVKHPEVIKRVEHARQELNAMERYDLSPSEIEGLPKPERDLANWALPKSRNIRHLINQVITGKSVSDLESAAAEAERTAHEFVQRLWALPAPGREECEPCEAMEDLRAYVARRRKGNAFKV